MYSLRYMLLAMICPVVLPGDGAVGVSPKSAQKEESAAPFQDALLKTAAEYKTWGRVDDEMRWAPTLCRTPQPGRAYVSASDDEQTHGKKLYSLLAKKRDDYFILAKEIPIGFAIVKQSWAPEEVTDPKLKPKQRISFEYSEVIRTPLPKDRPGSTQDDHFFPYAWKGDKLFKATKQVDLFIMMKFAKETPGTDNGWVYGTVTPDGKKVTSSGMVESCMKCHREAQHERLFGLTR